MNVENNKSLKSYNTFGIDVIGKYFITCHSKEEIINALRFAENENLPILPLGGGSNLLFTKNFEGVVILISLRGISILEQNEDEVLISARAGENWNDFVQYCLSQDFGGLENLSLIPGNVGTSPMQNIGAYGVEIKDVFHSLTAINIETKEIKKFYLEDCKFSYRESFFKTEGKNKYIITDVCFKLTKKNHKLNTAYGDIQKVLDEKLIKNPTIQQISQVVIHIRTSKLPNPKEIGNAGSFFKNPTISKKVFEQLNSKFPELKGFETSEGIKISAAFLIEKAGFKGYRMNDFGVHQKQALVLVNYGNSTGNEIFQFSEQIINKVNELFKVKLQREVNVY